MKRGEASITHGHKRYGVRTGVYVSWMNMKARCDNEGHKDYKHYGARGITYQASWRDFAEFLKDMGDRPAGMTIERKNNDLGYSKDNCRWATRAEQNLNKRSCVRYAHDGRSMTLSEWSRETGIGRGTLLKRLQRGVPVALALSKAGYLKMPTGLLRIA